MAADLDQRSSEGAPVNADSSAASTISLVAVVPDGNNAAAKVTPVPDAAPQAANSEPDVRSEMDRAEEMVDYLAERVSSLTSCWGKKFLRLGSRARESAQDFWAEVQDFREGKKP
jgi:hypothetical protein